MSQTMTESMVGKFVTGMPEDQYHGAPGLSASNLKDLLKSPARYQYNSKNPREPTRDKVIGRAVHMLVLEPHRFDDVFTTLYHGDKLKASMDAQRTLRFKEWRGAVLMSDALGALPIIQRIEHSAHLGVGKGDGCIISLNCLTGQVIGQIHLILLPG